MKQIQDLIPRIDLVGLPSLDDFPNKNITHFRFEGGRSRTRYSSPNIGVPLETSYTEDLIYEFKEDRNHLSGLKPFFNSKLFIDLGAGTNLNGYILAKSLGARGYVGVEPHFFQELSNELELHGKNGIPYSVVPTDMLNFLKKIPSETLGLIYTGGVDNLIISEHTGRAASSEIERTLRLGGHYLNFPGNDSNIKTEGLTKVNSINRPNGYLEIWEK